MRWRRVAIEVCLASALVGLGTFGMMHEYESGEGIASLLMNVRHVIQLSTNAGPLLPTNQCPSTTTSTLRLNGTCSFLNGLPGCCTEGLTTEAFPPVGNCDTNCTALYYAFYCAATCLPALSGAPQVCKSSLDRVWDACATCGLVGGTNSLEWIRLLGLQWTAVDDLLNPRSRACTPDPFIGCGCNSHLTCNALSPICTWDPITSTCRISNPPPPVRPTPPCVDFLAQMHESTGPPILLNISISPGSLSVVDILAPTPSHSFIITIYVTSLSFLFNAQLTISDPIAPSVMSFAQFTETARNSNTWVAHLPILPTSLAPSGNWTVQSLVARNENSTLSVAGTLATILVSTSLSRTNLTDVNLCPSSAGGNTGPSSIAPSVSLISVLTFCSSATPAILRGQGLSTPIQIDRLTFNTTDGLLQEGSFNIGIFGVGNQAGRLRLSVVRLTLTLLVTFLFPLTIVTGGGDTSMFDIAGTSTVTTRVVCAVTHRIRGQMGIVGQNSQWVAEGRGEIEGIITLSSAAQFIMQSPNVTCAIGSVTGTGVLRVVSGTGTFTSGCDIGGAQPTTVLIDPSSVALGHRFRPQQFGGVLECCGVCGGTGPNRVAPNGVLRVRSCVNTDCHQGSCTGAATASFLCSSTSTARSGPETHQVAATIGGPLTVENTGVVEFSDVGSVTNFGVLQINGTLDLQAGSVVRVRFSTGLPDGALDIPLIKYVASAQTGAPACSVGGSLQVVNPPEGRQAQLSCNSLTTACGTGHFLRLLLPASSAGAPPPSTATGFVSNQLYTLTSTLSCPDTDFTNFEAAVTRVFPMAAGQLVQRGISPCLNLGGIPAGIVFSFQCASGSSVAAAENLCRDIVTEATRPGSSLNAALRVTTGTSTQPNDDSSNTALYALFALFIVPYCCLGAIYCWCTAQRRAADNQYAIDIATFSNASTAPHSYPYVDSMPAKFADY